MIIITHYTKITAKSKQTHLFFFLGLYTFDYFGSSGHTRCFLSNLIDDAKATLAYFLMHTILAVKTISRLYFYI